MNDAIKAIQFGQGEIKHALEDFFAIRPSEDNLTEMRRLLTVLQSQLSVMQGMVYAAEFYRVRGGGGQLVPAKTEGGVR